MQWMVWRLESRFSRNVFNDLSRLRWGQSLASCEVDDTLRHSQTCVAQGRDVLAWKSAWDFFICDSAGVEWGKIKKYWSVWPYERKILGSYTKIIDLDLHLEIYIWTSFDGRNKTIVNITFAYIPTCYINHISPTYILFCAYIFSPQPTRKEKKRKT